MHYRVLICVPAIELQELYFYIYSSKLYPMAFDNTRNVINSALSNLWYLSRTCNIVWEGHGLLPNLLSRK